MTAVEIRKKFIQFFEGKHHTLYPGASLIPQNDPSVLFTTAGMQQFKPYYTEPQKAPHKRVVTIQPCFRTSDIDEVGDTTHLTFFEMLGNFSFGYKPDKKRATSDNKGGPYFKQEAIEWAWEFFTSPKWLNIDPQRIEVSVFRGERNLPLDEESIRVWRDTVGVSDAKIRMGTREENFWGPTGNEGPCGPTTEVYIDGIEVWNVVFNEYYQDSDGNLIPAEFSGVDTGMGLERLAAVLTAKSTVFETELYQPCLKLLAPLKLPQRLQRILADHLKGIVFLIQAGVHPSNLGREYILRRLLRRVLILDEVRPMLKQLVPEVVKMYQQEYKFESDFVAFVMEVVNREQVQFSKTLEKGKVYIKKFDKTRVSGMDAFYIYSTFGIPIDAQKDLFGEKVAVDTIGFEREFLQSLEEHRERSRAGAKQKFGGHGLITKEGEIPANLSQEDYQKALRNHTATHLLLAALRHVLGAGVRQRGSDISPDRLRFDFSHEKPLSQEEKEKVEHLVNKWIGVDLAVHYEEIDKDEALKSGAIAMFPERYPQRVKIYTIGNIKKPISREFCGGPHVAHTGEIHVFHITSEKSSSAGARRIKAVTG